VRSWWKTYHANFTRSITSEVKKFRCSRPFENVRQRSRDTQKPLQNGHFSLCLCPTLFVLIRLQSPVLLVSVLVSGEQMFTFSILLRTEE